MSGPSPDVGQPNQVVLSSKGDDHSRMIYNWLETGGEGAGVPLGNAMLQYFYKQADYYGVEISNDVAEQERKRIEAYLLKLRENETRGTNENIQMIRNDLQQEALRALMPHVPRNDGGAARDAITEKIEELNPQISTAGVKRTADGGYGTGSDQPMETTRLAITASDDQIPASAPDQIPTASTASAPVQGQFDLPSVQPQANPLQAPNPATLSFQGDLSATLQALISEVQTLKDKMPDEPMQIEQQIQGLQDTFREAIEQIRLKEKEIDNQHSLALQDMRLKQVQTTLQERREDNAAAAERQELSNTRLRDSENYAVANIQAHAALQNTLKTSQIAMKKIDTELEAMKEASASRREEHVERMEQINSQTQRNESNNVVAEKRNAAQHEENLAQNNRQLQTSLEQFKLQSTQRAQEHEANLKAIETKEAADARRHAETMEATAKSSAVQLAQIQAQQEMTNRREDRLLQDAREERILREKIALQQADAARQAAQMKMMNETPANAKHFLMQIKAMLAESKKEKAPAPKKIKS